MAMLDAVKRRSPTETRGAGSRSKEPGFHSRTACHSVTENARTAAFTARKKTPHSTVERVCSQFVIMIAPVCLSEVLLSEDGIASASHPAYSSAPASLSFANTSAEGRCDRYSGKFRPVFELSGLPAFRPWLQRSSDPCRIGNLTTLADGAFVRHTS